MLTMNNKEVKFGRRKGSCERSLRLKSLLDSVTPDSNSLILSQKEWQRIQDHITRKVREEKERLDAIATREKLKKCSTDLVKNWNNTLMGYRKQRLEALVLQEQKLEEERVNLDKEEAAYQAKKREQLINHAKRLLYNQNDRVKKFHTALGYTYILKEREVQKELKMLLEKAYKARDSIDQAELKKELEEYDSIKREEAEERKRNRYELSQYHLKQVAENEHNAEIEKIQDYLELQQMNRLYEKVLDEQKMMDFGNQMKKKEALQRIKDFIDATKAELLLEEIRNQVEDAKNDIFNDAMFNIAKLKKRRTRELQKEVEDRNNLVQKIDANIAKKKEKEGIIMMKQMKEVNKENISMLREREEESHKLFEDVFKNRLEKIKENQLERDRLKEQEQLERQAIENRFKRYESKERDKFRRIREEKMKVCEFRKQQDKEKKRKEHKEIEESYKEAQDHFKDLREEEREFQKYVSGIIQPLEKEGANVYPLNKAAQEGIGGGLGPLLKERGGVRPSYLPSAGNKTQLLHLQNDDTELIKRDLMGTMTTYTRLGFIW